MLTFGRFAALATGYRPADVERTHGDVWKTTTTTDDRPKYSFILPPPNVTGNLHLGHALMCTVQVAQDPPHHQRELVVKSRTTPSRT